MADWDNEFLSKKQIYCRLREVSSDYGCHSVDKQSAALRCSDVLMEMPAADVAPVVHGKWVYNKNATDWGIGGYVCSECQNKNNNLPCNRVKSVRMFSGAKYCPECGALMQEEDNGEK